MSEEPTAQQDGVADPRLSTLNSHFQHDVLPRIPGIPLLATRQYEANGARTAHGRLHEEKTQLRPARKLIRTRLSIVAPALLDAAIHSQPVEQRFPAVRQIQSWLPYQRSHHDRVETRTSSPVRIIRDKDTLQHVRLKGLFPCGEGAGYAGGIVSAGIDGEMRGSRRPAIAIRVQPSAGHTRL